VFKRLSTAAASLVVAATVAAAVNVAPAAAHDAANVPYHSKPAAADKTIYAGGTCEFSFYSPTVLGLVSNQYVYWRPVGAFWANGQWNYRYGETRRALVSRTEMIAGWESYQTFGYNGWFFANGPSSVGYFPAGSTLYLGYQIWAHNFEHLQWTSFESC